MNKIKMKDIGFIVYINDYIKSEFDRKTGEVTYTQSNTALPGYSPRTIGIARQQSGWIVSVALSKDNTQNQKTDKSGRSVVAHRMKNLIANNLSTTENDKGITWVPYAYKDLLLMDPDAYNTLYGPLDGNYLDMAINSLNSHKG